MSCLVVALWIVLVIADIWYLATDQNLLGHMKLKACFS